MKNGDVAWVYILTNSSLTSLYIGVTTDLARRVWEHKSHLIPGFTQKYNVDKLIYCEMYQQIDDALSREKQLKGWSRVKKEKLISRTNPSWEEITLL